MVRSETRARIVVMHLLSTGCFRISLLPGSKPLGGCWEAFWKSLIPDRSLKAAGMPERARRLKAGTLQRLPGTQRAFQSSFPGALALGLQLLGVGGRRLGGRILGGAGSLQGWEAFEVSAGPDFLGGTWEAPGRPLEALWEGPGLGSRNPAAARGPSRKNT